MPPKEDTQPLPLPHLLPADPLSDLDFPTALCKGKKTCTNPISSYVSFAHLSSTSQSFVVGIDSISFSKTLLDALHHDGWK